ncbi:ADP-forming succinate--CoA ligase subunit beta [[Eubacterium] cellulosolvens]
MKLHEYMAKQIFAEYGLPTPKGVVISSLEDFDAQKQDLEYPIAIKSQVLIGGRGKAGGIKFADNEAEARSAVTELLGSELKGFKIRQLLLEKKADLANAQELYVGFTINREAKAVTCIMSSKGGVDIEQVARESPQDIAKLDIDPELGLQQFHCRKLAKQIGLTGKSMLKVADVAAKLYKVFKALDAELAEVNPLILTTDSSVLAVDSKLNIDNNALFRHPEFKVEREATEEYTDLEKEAHEAGLAYVDLDGDIGIIGCGAGLVMASLDILKQFDGEPANFLDVGGGATAENMAKALDIVMKKPGVKAIFVNIFGGITRCDEIAKGIVDIAPKIPLSVRMMGTNQEEGIKILRENNFQVYDTMEDSAENAVRLSKNTQGGA